MNVQFEHLQRPSNLFAPLLRDVALPFDSVEEKLIVDSENPSVAGEIVF